MTESATGGIEVHTLHPPERRMLLEMLASERSGEDSLHVAQLGRDETAQRLCQLSMACWTSAETIVFTHYGLHVAESLALRLVDRSVSLPS